VPVESQNTPGLNYKVQSPVLLLIFNRPDVTFRVFDQIKKAKPKKLYIAADGPRNGNIMDNELCKEARSVINKIDWECELKTHFRDDNKGCKIAVSSAISWFFDQEEEGIILEDDCLPANSFFYFCDAMLYKYRVDTRISTITGTNLQSGNKRGQASYYFSQFSNIWGWATWKRFWKNYDPFLAKYKEEDVITQLPKIFNDMFLREIWLEIFRKIKLNKIDTWDYQLQFLTFFENGLCVTPNVNLISNIGFREDATHTNNPQHHAHHANLPTAEITEILHPLFFLPEKDADYFFLKKEFYLEEKWRKFEKDKLLRRRFKNWLRNLFK
jgi:hypothetical protein